MSPQPDTASLPAPILQDWAPLTHCLDWHLGQLAFQHRGAQAFTTNEVPNLINQGGMSAYRAAEVLFASCAEAEAGGVLEDEIVCMELAIGLGLHSVQVLDRFQQRCADAGKDWYGRLTWYATDVTPKMLRDAQENGVFARHEGRVILARADALNPAVVVPLDTTEERDLSGSLRAVFHSYLLCVLPANVFRRTTKSDETSWTVLMARTVLRHPEALGQFSNLTVDGVRALAASRTSDDLMRLVPLYSLMDLDLTLAPLADGDHEDRQELERIADVIEAGLAVSDSAVSDSAVSDPAVSDPAVSDPAVLAPVEPAEPAEPATEQHTWVLHSTGAMKSVDATIKALRPDGFLLYRDYGPATPTAANSSHLYQHYGATTAIGVNHFALDSWVGGVDAGSEARGTTTWPEGEGDAAIKTRLIGRGAIPATRSAFVQQFDPSAFAQLQEAVTAARSAAANPSAAMDGYRRALTMERDNWVLLTEAADFALRQARNLELAQMLVGEALRINPWYGAQAWNCLGDIYWFSNQLDAAEEAFLRATKANPETHMGWYNLFLVARQRGDLERAVEMAAKALAMDRAGVATARLEPALMEATKLLQAQRTSARAWRKHRNAGSPV